MLVRVYSLKIANETLERTTGGQDSGLVPEDGNKLTHPEAVIVNLISNGSPWKPKGLGRNKIPGL